jgi:hypothetical protein
MIAMGQRLAAGYLANAAPANKPGMLAASP